MARGFAASFRPVQSIAQVCDALAVALGHGRVQEGPDIVLGILEQNLQLFEPGGDPFQIILDQYRRYPLADGVQDVFALFEQFGLLLLVSGALTVLRGPQGIHVARVFLAEELYEVVPHETGLQAGEDKLFQRFALDRLAVGAIRFALVLGGGAAVMGGIDLGISTTTAAAFGETGEQILRAVPAPQSGGFFIQFALAGFSGIPQLLRDDPQRWNLLNDPVGVVVQARDPPSGLRVLDKALAVPDEPPDIQLVIQDAGAAFAVAVDRALGPAFPRRRGDALVIELRSNRLGRAVFLPVFFKDAPDDGCLLFIDGAVAPDRLAVGIEAFKDIVAIGNPAAGLAVLDAPAQAATGLVREIAQEHRIHRALEADVKG